MSNKSVNRPVTIGKDGATHLGVSMMKNPTTKKGSATSSSYITIIVFEMACKQNLDLRCVLVPAPWVLGPKYLQFEGKEVYATLHLQARLQSP